jgi:GT2 family glycosyltransferase
MKLSYVIVTRNRRESLLRTLDRLESVTALPRHQWEVLVVDNASDDDTVSAVAHHHREVRLIRLEENEGMPARNHAIARAAGKYLCFLDDDSYPTEGAVPKALRYLGRYLKTAAIVARVVLPDGSLEGPAFPAVTLGGASIVRADALRQVGGFAPEFFRQAEEYDLSFRLWGAGFRIERFEDVVFGHDKVPGGRCSALTHRMDLRNNLILVERYLPRELRRAYRHDFIRRYAALAIADGCGDAVNAALHEARVWGRREAAVGRKTLKREALEQLFELERQSAAIAEWAAQLGLRRVAIADVSKNLYATYRACRRAKLEIVCIVDDRPAFAGTDYRGIPVLPAERAFPEPIDGVVLSNINPAQVDRRVAELGASFKGPILRLWHPKWIEAPTGEKGPGPVTEPGAERAKGPPPPPTPVRNVA